MRSLAIVQRELQSSTYIDQDQDQVGEYGLLNELTGLSKGRGPREGLNNQERLRFTSSQISIKDNLQHYLSIGYHLQVFLPHAHQVVTDTGEEQTGSTDGNSVDAQENRWIAYSWPTGKGSGSRVFAVDQKAKILWAPNITARDELIYHGDTSKPGYKAALKKNGTNFLHWQSLAVGNHTESGDGQIWLPVN